MTQSAIAAIISLGCLTLTVPAASVEDNLVFGHFKSLGGEFFESCDTLVKVKDCLAFVAVKVVMMTSVRHLITGWLSWDLHAADGTFGLEVFEGSINGGDTKRWNKPGGQSMNLFGKQRALLPMKNRLDRLFLPRDSGSGSLL